MDLTCYLLTFTTYGSWLHGDTRGSWERKRDVVGSGVVVRDDFRSSFERREMLSPTIGISAATRPIIERAILEACHRRAWHLLAMNVRTQHVHVVAAADVRPETVLQAFKAYATRRLREADLIGHDARVWSRHGSTRYLLEEGSVEAAVDYVLHRQGATLPGSIFAKPRPNERRD